MDMLVSLIAMSTYHNVYIQQNMTLSTLNIYKFVSLKKLKKIKNNKK